MKHYKPLASISIKNYLIENLQNISRIKNYDNVATLSAK